MTSSSRGSVSAGVTPVPAPAYWNALAMRTSKALLSPNTKGTNTMRTIILLASLTVLGFSGAAVAKDRDAASPTDVAYSTQAIQAQPHFRWNEN